MERYICIHGHFYQPPRENPWLETVEVQDSAYPYHDWNERITAECYAPNTAARIVDGQNRIVRIVNNFARISFNFGPTLLAWLERADPDVYAAILAADRESRFRFSGHGSALAQVYNHMILPLANRRDRTTQVAWGLRDFQRRFGRFPEGIWLPETAVDLATLDVLAEQGLLFTILAPHQARRIRSLSGRARTWRDLIDGTIDPSMAYLVRLPSGRTLSVFFYDGPISRSVAFDGLLRYGEDLAHRLASAFVSTRTWPQLVHIATDGETYGHHHRYGDMALAYALDYIESHQLARLTNYGEYLEKHPPLYEVEIVENTSWSCIHGIERWRSDCGCNCGSGAPGSLQKWTQAWRAPLRAALDGLRDTLAPHFEEKGRHFLRDPWAARNDYLDVVHDRSAASLDSFFHRHARRELSPAERGTTLKLLEMQRHAMLMYTSCGWFFSELSGIETVQILQHAGRVLHLARQVVGDDLEGPFLVQLEKARSNLPEQRDGRRIYEQLVRPAVVEWEKVAAHYAVTSLFEEQPPPHSCVHSYQVDRDDFHLHELGKTRLVVGRIRVSSSITQETASLSFGFLYLNSHNLIGGVRQGQSDDAYRQMLEQVTRRFTDGDSPGTICSLDRHLGGMDYSLRSLFRDEQRRILNQISQASLSEAEATYRQLIENHTPLLRFLTDLRVPLTVLSVPLPRALQTAAEFILNIDLRRAFEADPIDPVRVLALLKEA